MFDIRKLWTAAVAIVALMVPGARAVNAVQSRPAPTVRYVVQGGDTLWRIVARSALEGDPRRWISKILELNDLGSAALTPGQILRIPAL